MPARKKKTPSDVPDQPAPNQLRTGMPAPDSVQKVIDFVSPKGAKYQILRTNEADAYDQLPAKRKKGRKS